MPNVSLFCLFQTSETETYDCEIDLDDLLDLDDDKARRRFVQVSKIYMARFPDTLCSRV